MGKTRFGIGRSWIHMTIPPGNSVATRPGSKPLRSMSGATNRRAFVWLACVLLPAGAAASCADPSPPLVLLEEVASWSFRQNDSPVAAAAQTAERLALIASDRARVVVINGTRRRELRLDDGHAWDVAASDSTFWLAVGSRIVSFDPETVEQTVRYDFGGGRRRCAARGLTR